MSRDQVWFLGYFMLLVLSQKRSSLRLELRNCVKYTQTSTVKKLFQLKHIVREKNQHRVIVRAFLATLIRNGHNNHIEVT